MRNEKSVGRMIHILSHQLRRQIDISTAHLGVTGVQGRVLHFVIDNSKDRDIFQKDVEEAFRLRCSTATGTLQLMERNGLIRREYVDYDARLKRIIVTERGLEVQAQVEQCIQETEARLTEGICKEELEQFFELAARMSKNLE